MKPLHVALIVAGILLVALPLMLWVYAQVQNPKVVNQLRADPTGERAQKVMLITLPSGRQIPVNYLREGNRVYAGADGRWWKELVEGDRAVRVWIRGEDLAGRARAILDDPDYKRDIFARLRPKALPGFGTLIEIRLDPNDPGGPHP